MATINIFLKKLKKIILPETSLFQPYYIQKHRKITFPDRLSILGTERVKLERCIKKKKKKQNNIKFQRDRKEFLTTLEREQTREGKMPEI